MGVAAGTAEEVQALEDAPQHRANAGVHETRAAEYDSDARRAQLGQRVEAGGADHESVHARLVAANANAEPIKAAVAARKKGKSTRPRRQSSSKDRAAQLSR